ncbi:forkhead box protein P3 [Thalassophryne amazonica]|uniref:forkhead box protein P3 n=1 Tax=Thalassophryne amazonica TaxID=390379 RepID=UPI0014722A3A|nr:forkhead box protein P3 [Thalassophryne amazonica]
MDQLFTLTRILEESFGVSPSVHVFCGLGKGVRPGPSSVPDFTRVLFGSGLCRWPGCDTVSEDLPTFFKHLNSDHRHGDTSVAQWRIQQDMVQYLENQLILEKQKLFAMQLHLQLSEPKHSNSGAACERPCTLPVIVHPALAVDGGQHRALKHPDDPGQHGYWAASTVHLLPDLVPRLECYKYTNMRPPYTYAHLIRWSILDSPDKERSLSEIYSWFTSMFFYFRCGPATWKNAVRHNLSLHKCFVRVEGAKGAVWTVDEQEYQRRKGQKYYR